MRNLYGSTTLLLDAGNALFSSTPEKNRASALAKATAISAVYQRLDYDAIAVGSLDLSGGVGLLRATGSQRLPWISANVTDAKGTLLFTPYKTFTVAGISLAVTALTGSTSKLPEDIKTLPAAEALQSVITSFTSTPQMLIVLSSLPIAESQKIAEQFPDISIIVCADATRGIIADQIINRAVLMQTGDRGKYLGTLNVSWTGEPWGIQAEERRANINQRLARLNLQTKRTLSQSNLSREQRQKLLDSLKAARKQLEAERAALDKEANQNAKTDRPSRYKLEHIPLAGILPEDQEIKALIEETIGTSTAQ